MKVKTKKLGFFKHKMGLVDKGAKIGAESRIWAYAHVMSGAVIGSKCNIGNYAFIESGAKLGNGVTIKNAVQVWEGVSIEDDVFVGPACVFTNHLRPRAFLKRPKSEWLAKTVLKKGCTLGAGSVILSNLSVGRFALVGAGSVVTKNVPDHAVVVGNPAKIIGYVCKCGLTIGKNLKQSKSCKNCK